MRQAAPLFILPLLSIWMSACGYLPEPAATPTITPIDPNPVSTQAIACPVTEPLWVKPPDDSAVGGSPEYGYYFVNEDRSIWASAWWEGGDGYRLQAGEEGNKVGWFRPVGAELMITGQRIDAQAEPLEAHVPCCYPTRFQATGLIFPTEGCWHITARAADSELSFVVLLEP